MFESEYQLEKDFRKAIKQYEEIGMEASPVKKALNMKGAVKLAKEILDKHDYSEEFVFLFEEERLEISFEAIILKNEKYWDLFDEPQLKRAREKLRRMGFTID